MILVTGGAGYIGSHTVHRLAARGEPVVVLDNLYSGHRWAVPAGVELVEGDVADRPLVEGLLRKHRVRAVIHFAALLSVEESVSQPLRYYRNNVLGSLGLIEACEAAGVEHFIFSSSCSVYGTPTKNPIDETAPLDPLSPYARTKAVTERILLDLEAGGKSRMRSVILRYFNVAGAKVGGGLGQANPAPWQLVNLASEAACGKRKKLFVFGTDYPTPDGTCIRDYVHVDDLAEAHILALGHLAGGGKSEIFNCGYGKGYSVREVIGAMKRVTGVDFPVEEAPRRAGDNVALWADDTKIKKVLGWKPECADIELICRTAYQWEKQLQR